MVGMILFLQYLCFMLNLRVSTVAQCLEHYAVTIQISSSASNLINVDSTYPPFGVDQINTSRDWEINLGGSTSGWQLDRDMCYILHFRAHGQESRIGYQMPWSFLHCSGAEFSFSVNFETTITWTWSQLKWFSE